MSELGGKRVYALWRIDKNVSWFNVHSYFMGIIYGVLTFEWIHSFQSFLVRFKPFKLWLPPRYAKNYVCVCGGCE